MYAIFEEVVGPPKPAPDHTVPPSSRKDDDDEDDQGIVLTTEATEDPDPYASCRSRAKRLHSHYGSDHYHRYSTSLPRTNKRRQPITSSDTESIISTSSNNPLLDTISVLTYDPPDDSDDYYDLYDRRRSTTKAKSPSAKTGEVDSVGYAGSSSIDSGYKSFCPTPEIPVDYDSRSQTYTYDDPTKSRSQTYSESSKPRSETYSGEPTTKSRTQQQGAYDESSGGPSKHQPGRIMMGTKVMARQTSPVTSQVTPESICTRRSDSSLYDVNLDHLMYLRQSLLSAIQKCESTKPQPKNLLRRVFSDDSCPTLSDKTASTPIDAKPSSSSAVAASSATYQKTVRFNTDVKVTTLGAADGPSPEASKGKVECKVQSKSILKDPLCANLRSQLEAGAQDCTLEEEIDSLLYGRAEFYDLESVDDFPCSYVTMIEDKYRSGKPSLAKVRKLKAGKPQELSKQQLPTSAAEDAAAATAAEEPSSSPPTPASSAPPPGQCSPPTTVSISKTAKFRFTEVARCMLEIIEDLQLKKLQPEGGREVQQESDAGPPPPADAAPEPTAAPSCDNLSCYASAAEYHVYEEIAYDHVGRHQGPVDVPPPLPARPNGLLSAFPKGATVAVRGPSPPPRKGRCPLRRSSVLTEVRNRPKQRGNLYCLFADRLERRNISRSLEREWRDPKGDQEDDYGFRKEFPSI